MAVSSMVGKWGEALSLVSAAAAMSTAVTACKGGLSSATRTFDPSNRASSSGNALQRPKALLKNDRLG